MLKEMEYKWNGVSVRKNAKSRSPMVIKNVLIILILLLFDALPVLAREVSLSPALGINGEYNDNILFSEDQKVSDYIATLSPSFNIDRYSELLNLSVYAGIDFSRYKDNKTYNNENQNYSLKGSYRFNEKMTSKGDFSYLYDTTLDSYLDETGIVTNRQNRRYYNLVYGLSYRISDLSSMDINYAYRNIDYKLDESTDYDQNNISLSFNRNLKSERDFVTIQPSFYRNNSDYNEVDNYVFFVGWTHQPSENYQLRVFLGGRYTRITPNETGITDDYKSVTADISLNKKGQISSIGMGYRRQLNYDISGEAINVDRIYCDLVRQLSSRLRVGLSGNFYRSVSERENNEGKSRYFRLIPSLMYQLTEQHTLKLAYSYAWQKATIGSDIEKNDQNRILITLNLNFPLKI